MKLKDMIEAVHIIKQYLLECIDGANQVAELNAALREVSAEGCTKVITLCGSTRFKDAFIEANARETMKGNIVLSVGVFGHDGVELTEDQKTALDELHKRKIDLSSEILVLNVGGYIGKSTRSEIEYAKSHGKVITYLENDPASPPAKEERRELGDTDVMQDGDFVAAEVDQGIITPIGKEWIGEYAFALKKILTVSKVYRPAPAQGKMNDMEEWCEKAWSALADLIRLREEHASALRVLRQAREALEKERENKCGDCDYSFCSENSDKKADGVVVGDRTTCNQVRNICAALAQIESVLGDKP